MPWAEAAVAAYVDATNAARRSATLRAVLGAHADVAVSAAGCAALAAVLILARRFVLGLGALALFLLFSPVLVAVMVASWVRKAIWGGKKKKGRKGVGGGGGGSGPAAQGAEGGKRLKAANGGSTAAKPRPAGPAGPKPSSEAESDDAATTRAPRAAPPVAPATSTTANSVAATPYIGSP